MPHADAAIVPETIQDKTEFWEHVLSQLQLLIDGEQRNWVTNLANASSVIYHALRAFPKHFGDGANAVIWCGFYLDQRYFPSSRRTNTTDCPPFDISANAEKLLLGPFCGKPACQFINVAPGKARGVCADAFTKEITVVVSDVNLYPAHIACDSETQSEIVCPLILRDNDGYAVLGVLDLDCLAVGGFDGMDKAGLERIASFIVQACDW